MEKKSFFSEKAFFDKFIELPKKRDEFITSLKEFIAGKLKILCIDGDWQACRVFCMIIEEIYKGSTTRELYEKPKGCEKNYIAIYSEVPEGMKWDLEKGSRYLLCAEDSSHFIKEVDNEISRKVFRFDFTVDKDSGRGKLVLKEGVKLKKILGELR